MIINGNSRSNAKFFTKHLLNAEQNERVEVKEIRGFVADNVPDAFKEIEIIGSATRAKNSFYHSNINPDEGEKLTQEQWEQTIDTLEKKLGLGGQPRLVIAHEKKDREHMHVVWSRIDSDSMTAIPMDNNYLIHTETARELERMFGHEPTPVPPHPERDRFKDWETFRGQDSGIDPKEMKAEITALWQQSDGGRAFQAAIEEQGYILAKGDRRDFVLIDPAGDVHSLARRIDGAKAADIRAKMTDLDRDSLLSAKEASAWMKAREEAENSGSSDARILPEEERQEREQPSEVSGGTVPTVPPASPLSPKLAILEKYALNHPPEFEGYITLNSAEEFSDYYRKQFAAPLGSVEYWERMKQEDSSRQAWDNEQARLAEIDRRQGQAEARREHEPPEGEPPVEPVSFERATGGIDPPQNFTGREAFKRDTETWTEYIGRMKPPEKEQGRDKTTTDEQEPELER